MNLLKNFVRDEQGQDLIEYALLLGFMVVAGAAASRPLMQSLVTIWDETQSRSDSAATKQRM